MNIKRKQSGFTLIELMVVIAILAMLAGVVGVQVMGQGHKANVKTVISDCAKIDTGLNLYKLENKRYPSDDQGLEVLSPDYLSKTAKDPWGNPYDYSLRGSKEYNITSFGADGEQGGTDEDADLVCGEIES